MQARFYAPQYGRFSAPDPARDQHFEDTQSWNIYSYVRNSPIMSTDPTGMVTQILAPNQRSADDSRIGQMETENADNKKKAQTGAESKNALTASDPSVSTVKAQLNSLADAFKVPRDVVLAVAQKESNFDTTAVNENKNSKGQVVSTDYGVMQINSSNIGGTVRGSDGKSFTISDSVKTDWKENAKVGVAMVAQEYRAAGKDQPKGTAETKAQQTYSGYNAGPSGRQRYTERNKSGGFADGRDRGFLDIYRSLQNQ